MSFIITKEMKHIKIVNKGFTLIELLVVISIIGILISLSLFGIQNARMSSRNAKRKSDLESIRSALEMYKADKGSYPTSGLNALTSGNYLSSIPSDPLPGRNYSYNSTGATYNLCAALEGSFSSVTGCSPCGVTCNYKVTNP